MLPVIAPWVLSVGLSFYVCVNCGGGKKKEAEFEKLKPKQSENKQGSGGDGAGSQMKQPSVQREADDMETVDGCKSNWGAVQNVNK